MGFLLALGSQRVGAPAHNFRDLGVEVRFDGLKDRLTTCVFRRVVKEGRDGFVLGRASLECNAADPRRWLKYGMVVPLRSWS